MQQTEQPDLVDLGDASRKSGSDDVSPENDEELYRTTLEARIAHWRIQLQQERLTPMLQLEMLGAIQLTNEAMQKPRASANAEVVESLETLHNDITEHWCKVFKNPEDRSILMANISHYEVVFTGMLYEDYVSQSANVLESLLPGDEWFSNVSSQVQQHRELMRNSKSNHEQGTSLNEDKDYQENILFPLEEMCLGSLVSHAENRLCTTAAARQAGAQYTGAYVPRLIQACDWQSLAETLIYDRELVTELCSYATIQLNWEWLKKKLLPQVLRTMDELERKYFTDLSSPTSYSISAHAADMLSGKSSKGKKADHVPLARTLKAERQVSPISKIKGRLRLLADGLNMKLRKDATTASRASPLDEKDPLLFRDQKDTAISSIRPDEKGSW